MNKESRKLKREERKANRKPFSETGIGKFLKNTAPDILGVVGSFLPDAGTLGIVRNLINRSSMPIKDRELALGILDLEFKDVQNARDNETARDISQYSSFLSKNIHEIIALTVIGSWIITWFLETRVEDGIIASAVMLILGYLYGRTKPQD